MTNYEFKPDYVVLPGATIKETLECNGQTITDLAKATDETLDYLTDVIEARAPITEELAIKFEEFFHITARFWLNLQDSYDSGVYRLFWERARKLPNLFAHFTDDQLEAIQALHQSVDYNTMPSTEEVELYKNIEVITSQLDEEFSKRFFPEKQEKPC